MHGWRTRRSLRRRVDAAERLVRLADTADTIAAILKQIDVAGRSATGARDCSKPLAASRAGRGPARCWSAACSGSRPPRAARRFPCCCAGRPGRRALLTAIEKRTHSADGTVGSGLAATDHQSRCSDRRSGRKKAAGTARLPDADRQKVIDSLPGRGSAQRRRGRAARRCSKRNVPSVTRWPAKVAASGPT